MQSGSPRQGVTMHARLAQIGIAVVLAALGSHAAASSGTITQLSGTLSVRKADGSVRILSQRSTVESGDTINTERESFAQIRFSDGGQVTLKPNTSVKIQSFRFAEEKPQEDSFVYRLVKGGLRTVTGLVGKRSKDKYELETATATVGIRGTTLSADDCLNHRGGDCSRLEAAVYVGVADGEVVVRNGQGELGLAAGQFGLVAPNQRPLFLSTDPGLQFTPPATFIQSVMTGSVVNAGKNLECIVSR
ncbi:MAG TPA: FecR domain-containing protein [Burkholderiales bacterium]|nr:FecR domain-containing protein [Burkholderiales bacterium]